MKLKGPIKVSMTLVSTDHMCSDTVSSELYVTAIGETGILARMLDGTETMFKFSLLEMRNYEVKS